MTKKFNGSAATARELSNLFIWSAFKYYMKKKEDSYVVFSPIKYWKSEHILSKKCVKGFMFNREHFHATPSVISCILWSNENEQMREISLEAIDIIDGGLSRIGDKTVKIVERKFTQEFYDGRKFDNDVSSAVYLDSSGTPGNPAKYTKTGIYNDNIVGFLMAKNYAIDPMNKAHIRTNPIN